MAFNMQFVLSTTANIEIEQSIEESIEHKLDYDEPTLKQTEIEIHQQQTKKKELIKQQQIKHAYERHQKKTKAAKARRQSQQHIDDSEQNNKQITIRHPTVQRLTRSYKRAARNERPDQMKSIHQQMSQDIAPQLTSRDRRKLWKQLLKSASKFQKRPEVVLLPTYDERKLAAAAKTNWAQGNVQICLCCSTWESDLKHCGTYGAGFLPLVPCGHKVLCQKCSEICTTCPACSKSIDHQLATFLRPQTPIVSELNEILSDIRLSRSDNLGLVRRAALARVRDARHVKDNTNMVHRGKSIKGDRTSRILHDLGTAAVSTGKLTALELKTLDSKWEKSIEKACQETTAMEGQMEMLKLFSKLSPRINGSKENHNQDQNGEDDEGEGERKGKDGSFTLERSDNTAWNANYEGIIWHYDEHVNMKRGVSKGMDEGQDGGNSTTTSNTSTESLPYVASKSGSSRMQRFKARMNPRIKLLETLQYEMEIQTRTKEHASETDVHIQKSETHRMLMEDELAHKSRYWNMSKKQRENITTEMDLDMIYTKFKELNKEYKKKYTKYWFKEYQSNIIMLRGVRSAMFALKISEIQRMGASLICYQQACKDRNEGVLHDLERQLKERDELPGIDVTSLSEKHVLCIIDLLFCCGRNKMRSLDLFSLSFSKIGIHTSTLLGRSLTTICNLRTIAIQNCSSNDNACSHIINTIADQCKMLEELNMSHNRIKDTILFNSSLTKLVASETLRMLDLSHNRLGVLTGSAIAGGLQEETCRIEVINIAWNELKKDGTTAILTSLRSKTSAVRVLNVGYNGFRRNEVDLKVSGTSIEVLAEGIYNDGVVVTSPYKSRYPAPRVKTPPLRRRRKNNKKKSGTKQQKKKKKK